MLGTTDHSRDSAGLTYVYPVVSRRAGGVSVGINLNPNNACNWHCVYCQVPGLVRGAAPAIDVAQLERELRGFVAEVVGGRFLDEQVPEGARRIVDVALSGNGEPTSAHAFPEVVAVVGGVLRDFGLAGRVKPRLITNGSLVARKRVVAGLERLSALGGEVWFKVDAGTRAGARRINGVAMEPEAAARRLRRCAELCATWVQTCVFAMDGMPPGPAEWDAYLALLAAAGPSWLRGVHLYGLARPSLQPAAPRLLRLDAAELERYAGPIREKLGLTVLVSP